MCFEALRFCGLCLLIQAVLIASPARASPANDSKTCARESGDAAIAACTRAIKSGRFNGYGLETLYF